MSKIAPNVFVIVLFVGFEFLIIGKIFFCSALDSKARIVLSMKLSHCSDIIKVVLCDEWKYGVYLLRSLWHQIVSFDTFGCGLNAHPHREQECAENPCVNMCDAVALNFRRHHGQRRLLQVNRCINDPAVVLSGCLIAHVFIRWYHLLRMKANDDVAICNTELCAFG